MAGTQLENDMNCKACEFYDKTGILYAHWHEDEFIACNACCWGSECEAANECVAWLREQNRELWEDMNRYMNEALDGLDVTSSIQGADTR